jgi:hypothetical protein
MPRKSRKNKATQDNEQEKQQSRFTWTVHAALDKAIQQDCLKKRAGQGFKAEAMLVITAAVQEKVDAELGIRVTTNQVETKLDTVRSLSAHLPIICFFSPLLFIVILIPRQLKSRLKKYMQELEKKISGFGWDDERYTVTAPLAAWEALYKAHKDNKKHYGWFQHNSFRERDKLLILYADKMATGEHARAAWQPKEGEDETSDDEFSVTSQIRRMVEKERDVLEIIDDEPEDDRVGK